MWLDSVWLLLCISGATEASSGDLDLELAAMQTCYGQLKQLVPTVPVNGELSRLQLLQHVIDYIVDLELALHSSASMSSSPQRRQHQQPESSACRSRTTTTHINDQQSLSTVSSADEQLTAYDCDNCSTTEIAQTLPQSILNESTSWHRTPFFELLATGA